MDPVASIGETTFLTVQDDQVFEQLPHKAADLSMASPASLTGWLCSTTREVGRIWGADFDIDIAGTLLDGSMIYGESKWWKDPVGENILDQLIERASLTYKGPAVRRINDADPSPSSYPVDLETMAQT